MMVASIHNEDPSSKLYRR